MPTKELLGRLGYDEVAKGDRPRLGEDYVFDPGRSPAAKDFNLDHESVFLQETPLAIVRRIHLQHGRQPHTSVQVTLAACWNGFRDALALLARFAGSFERAIPEGAANSARAHQVGDFGVTWAWSEKGGPDVLGFVRKNVLVGMRGSDAGESIVSLAREIDAALNAARSAEPYGDTPHTFFNEVRRRAGEVPRVPTAGKLPLGSLPDGGSHFFFRTSGGSVNREADNPQSWYYRAGTQKGRQEIALYWVTSGILPHRDRLSVEVV